MQKLDKIGQLMIEIEKEKQLKYALQSSTYGGIFNDS